MKRPITGDKSAWASDDASRRRPAFGRFLVAVVPLLVVLFAVVAMVHGLLLLLRGDESLRPIFWAAVAPVASVVVGLGAQMLLVNVFRRPGDNDDNASGNDASFL
jgi:hypothetical protein